MMSSFRYVTCGNKSRVLPVLKRTYCTLKTALIETDSVKKKDSKDIDRYREQKKYKPNLVEGIFLGNLHCKVLEYPQIRTLEEVEYLREHKEKIESILRNELKPEEVESRGKIKKDALEILYQNDVIGTKIKSKGKSLGYLESESSYIQEALALSPSMSKTVSELEGAGYQAINLFGSDAQKNEYIPKFLDGSCNSCLAHLENGSWVSSDPLKTVAVKQEDGNYRISGRKTLVYNPSNSDIIFVSARTSQNEDNADSYTLFMVDKNSKGVTINKPLETIGLKSVEVCDVVFDNVIVSEDEIVGNINEGNVIVNKLAPSKLSNGAQCVGIMRKVLNDTIDHCIHKQHFQRPLYKYQYIQGIIGEMVSTVYSAESMTYLMFGRVDVDSEANIMLEALLVKIFTSEALNVVLHNCLQCMGREKGQEYIDTIVRDSNFFSAFDDSNDYLRHYLGRTGVDCVLKNIKKSRLFKIKKLLQVTQFEISGAVIPPGILQGYLHPALKQESLLLEFFLAHLCFWTTRLIRRYGDDIFNRTYELCMLGELAILIYRLASVLGRASRSYCIGLRHAEHDILIARIVASNCHIKQQMIKNSFERISERGEKFSEIGRLLLDGGKYSPVHPADPVQSKSQM